MLVTFVGASKPEYTLEEVLQMLLIHEQQIIAEGRQETVPVYGMEASPSRANPEGSPGRKSQVVHKEHSMICQVCNSSQDVEDEQRFLFSCPAYSDVTQKHASPFQQAFSVSDLFTDSEPNACGGFLRESFPLRKSIVST